MIVIYRYFTECYFVFIIFHIKKHKMLRRVYPKHGLQGMAARQGGFRPYFRGGTPAVRNRVLYGAGVGRFVRVGCVILIKGGAGHAHQHAPPGQNVDLPAIDRHQIIGNQWI